MGVLHAQDEVLVENDSLLLWQVDRPLTWEDFKGPKQYPKDKQKTHHVAGTATKIRTLSYVEKGVPNFQVWAYFEKYRSWSITDTIKTLKHEQLHFDIQELYVRKMRKRFVKMNASNIKTVALYQEALQTLMNESGQYQLQYDKEVLFNPEKQKEWYDNIAQKLKKLKSYEYVPKQ